MNKLIAVLSVSLVLGHAAVRAEGLPITPGMWETTTTIENSITGNRTDTQKNCIKESELDPSSQTQGMPQDQCEVDTKVDGKTMTYSMVCAAPQGAKMKFNGRVTVDGDSMQGAMQMDGSMAGRAITMNAKTSGKRLGEC